MKPIYKPKGRAGEYGEYAINIYTGCPHGCEYCYARKMSERFGKDFSKVEPRAGIVEAIKEQFKKEAEELRGKLIHLCFMCDPYPKGTNTQTTREVIKEIKSGGANVQILTKNGGHTVERDFDLLDENDWFGVTISGDETKEPGAHNERERLATLYDAKQKGIKTWVSCEPVLNPKTIFALIEVHDYIDEYKIGKLNYAPSEIDWGKFGRECERLCKKHKRRYIIKEDLRKEMQK